MSDRSFLDTNVFVYTFDDSAPSKRDVARKLVSEALLSGRTSISFQVVQEFLNVATRKFQVPMKPADALRYLDQVLAPLCHVFASVELYRKALGIQDRWRSSFYDSLLIAAALEGSCDRLLSEDLQDGQRIEGLTIENPFRASASSRTR